MIKLDKSADYSRLALLIYFSAIVVLYKSAWIFFLKVMVLIFLLLRLIRILRNPIPSSCSLLVYTNTNWSLHDKHGRQQAYTKMRVVISTGLFLLVEFSKEKQRKTIVIFVDQMSQDDCRLLKIIDKIN